MKQEKNIVIRNEIATDYAKVEDLTREAFWNIYQLGCDEHYLVHSMRSHKDFIPELDFVLLLDDEIIGNIMYTKAKLVDFSGREKNIVTFGPLTIEPEYQRQGYGKQLIEYSFAKAKELGYDTIVIFGNPSNYIRRGFKSCKKYNISLEGGMYPTAMLVKELVPADLAKKEWTYYQSSVMEVDEKLAEKFDKQFPPKEKKHQASQEEFFIYSHSSLQ